MATSLVLVAAALFTTPAGGQSNRWGQAGAVVGRGETPVPKTNDVAVVVAIEDQVLRRAEGMENGGRVLGVTARGEPPQVVGALLVEAAAPAPSI